MAVGLPKTYRFQVLNSTGQTITQNSGILVKALRQKLSSTGAMSFESSATTILDNAATDVTTGSVFSGSTVDNSSDGYMGGEFEYTVVAPASSNGDVTLYLQSSVDGGTTWPDDSLGRDFVAVLNFTTNATKRTVFRL